MIGKDTSLDASRLFQICRANMKASEQYKEYLFQRGINEDLAEKYQLGLFPKNVGKLLQYVSEEFLMKSSIIDGMHRSAFADQYPIIFPIHSEYSEPIAISGRTILSEDERQLLGVSKYKNSSYKKANFLYGLNHSRQHILKQQNVYVVEGFFDLISADKYGIRNCVAICGTAFSKMHFIKLARYTDKITFLLDSDDAGQKSAESIYNKYVNKGVKLRFLTLPENVKDLDEYFSQPKTNIDSFLSETREIIPDLW